MVPKRTQIERLLQSHLKRRISDVMEPVVAWGKAHAKTILFAGLNKAIPWILTKGGPTWGPIIVGMLGLTAVGGAVTAEATDIVDVTGVVESVVDNTIGELLPPPKNDPIPRYDKPESHGITCNDTQLPVIDFSGTEVRPDGTEDFAVDVWSSTGTIRVELLTLNNLRAQNIIWPDTIIHDQVIIDLVGEQTMTHSPAPVGSSTPWNFPEIGRGFEMADSMSQHLIIDADLKDCDIAHLNFDDVLVRGTINFEALDINKVRGENIQIGDSVKGDADWVQSSDTFIGSASSTGLLDEYGVVIE